MNELSNKELLELYRIVKEFIGTLEARKEELKTDDRESE